MPSMSILYRWRETASGQWFTAVVISCDDTAVDGEIRAILRATSFDVRRVVKLVEQIQAGPGQTIIILE